MHMLIVLNCNVGAVIETMTYKLNRHSPTPVARKLHTSMEDGKKESKTRTLPDRDSDASNNRPSSQAVDANNYAPVSHYL